MARKASAEVRRQREDARKRVRWVLDNLHGGRQVRMAAALGVSQSLISRIVAGKQGPGPDFLQAMKRLPGLNPHWVDSGEGEPLLTPTSGTLPIAHVLLPAEQGSWPALVTGERHPVADAYDRPSRYWLRLAQGRRDLALLPGDLLLFETDRATWEGRLSQHVGQLCGVRLADGRYEMAQLKMGEGGPICELLDVPATEGAARHRTNTPFGRTPRGIDVPGDDPSPEPQRPDAASAPATHVAVEHVVAVRVYTARP